MKKRRVILFLAMLLVLMLALPGTGLADMGSFSGDSDFGGGSSWGSSDWGSSDWGSSDWDSDSDYDSGSDLFLFPALFGSLDDDGGDDGSTGLYDGAKEEESLDYDDEEGGGFSTIIGLIVVAFIVITILRNRKRGQGTSVAPGAAPTDQSLLMPISDLIARDPLFGADKFREKLSNIYVQMQQQWQGKDISPLREYFTDALYSQFARQLDQYVANGQTNVVDRVAVLGVKLMGCMQDDVNDIIVARLNTRIVDYVVDDKTGALVRGSTTKELFMDYEWTLIRPSGTLTPEQETQTTLNCPNCGAPLDVNYAAKCPYCGSVITTSEYSWVISAIKGISQVSSGN